MNREDLRAYALRRWDLVEAHKLRERSAEYRSEGPDASVRRWEMLYEHGLSIGVVSAESRAQDLEDHIAWRAKLDRVGRERSTS
jgi:hypothetical protein